MNSKRNRKKMIESKLKMKRNEEMKRNVRNWLMKNKREKLRRNIKDEKKKRSVRWNKGERLKKNA